jgi:hypothetical protein
LEAFGGVDDGTEMKIEKRAKRHGENFLVSLPSVKKAINQNPSMNREEVSQMENAISKMNFMG